MTIEEDLCTALTLLCPRTFPDFAPVGTPRPYVTYQQIGGEALAFLDQTIPSTKNADIQINVWADTRAQASALILQIENMMITATAFQASAYGAPANNGDAELKLYSSRQDFSVWSDR